MCGGNPDEMLAKILEARPLQPTEHGPTPLDLFEHFSAYAGCNEVRKESYA